MNRYIPLKISVQNCPATAGPEPESIIYSRNQRFQICDRCQLAIGCLSVVSRPGSARAYRSFLILLSFAPRRLAPSCLVRAVDLFRGHNETAARHAPDNV